MSYQLGNTEERINVDQDAVYVSFGADTDAVHCWTCGDDQAMRDGAWLIPGRRRDARLGWEDGERYAQPPMPSWMTEERNQTLVCCGCAVRLGFGDTAKQVKTAGQKAAARAYGAGTN